MITNEEIMDVMRAVLKTDVDESTSQNNSEKCDSMNHLNLVIELEDTFEVEFVFFVFCLLFFFFVF